MILIKTAVFFICLQLIKCKGQEELEMIIEFFRHGARHNSYANMEYRDTSLLSGELTQVGMHQQYQLGLKLRKRYIDELNLVDRSFNPDQFYIYSTNYNRTMDSCRSQLYGIFQKSNDRFNNSIQQVNAFPPLNISLIQKLRYINKLKTRDVLQNNLQTIPIETSNAKNDLLTYNQNCEYLNFILKRKVQGDHYLHMSSRYNGIQQLIKDELGEEITEKDNFIEKTYQIFDNIVVDSFKGKEHKISDELFRQMSQLYNQDIYYNKFGDYYQRYIVSSPMLQKILKHMDDNVQNTSTVKWYIYSVHDSNIGALLSSLNLTSYQCNADKKWIFSNNNYDQDCIGYPGYTSNIIFELWRDRETNDRSVKISYNGEYRTNICNQNLFVKCPYEKFVQQIKSNLIVGKDRERICKKMDIDIKNDTLLIYLLVIILLAIFVMFLTYLIIKMCNKLKNQRRKDSEESMFGYSLQENDLKE